MFDDLEDLYQQVILDHSKSPRNFHKMEGANGVAEGHNPLCGDQIKVYLLMEGNRIKDVSFEGSGCAISKASASMMTEAVKGKSRDEIQKLFEGFHQMIITGEMKPEETGKLSAFAGVHKFPARVKCAILSWHAMIAALEGQAEKVSTE
jgi:nitrogen fixation protein NifU and related proteins